MRIAVYDCVTGDKLTEKYGRTSGQIIRWIEQYLPEATFLPVHIAGGERPLAPDEIDGVIISGSEKGVYDDTPWMAPLRDNLQVLRTAGIPMFGICFGHQIMADAFGGKAEKADQGFVTGSRQFRGENEQITSYLAHQDQVTRVPPDARVTASAPYCPVAALAYDFPALSVQFHPEYDAGFTADLIDLFGHMLMTTEEIEVAKSTIPADVSSDLYCKEVAAFFRSNAR